MPELKKDRIRQLFVNNQSLKNLSIMLIYGIDSDDGLMEHIRREIKRCNYFHVISNENGIYSLDTDRSRCRPGKGESLVCKFENGKLTWESDYTVEYHGNIIDDE